MRLRPAALALVLFPSLACTSSGPSSTDQAKWNEAYGWGPHADAGYVRVEGDPAFGASPASTITSQLMSGWSAAASWGNHADAGYLRTELDPAFTAAPAAGVTSGMISNWNTAHGWGDHADAG